MKLRRTLIIAFAVLSALAVWDMVASGPDRFENRMFVYVEFSDGIGRVPARPPDLQETRSLAPAALEGSDGAGAARTVTLDPMMGWLRVGPSAGGEVTAEYTVRVWTDGSRGAAERAADVARAVTARWLREGESLRLALDRPARLPGGVVQVWVDVQLGLPEGVELVASHTGDVVVEQVSGGVRLENIAGRVALRQVQGPVAVTGRGVDLSASQLQGPLRLDLRGGRAEIEQVEGTVTGAMHYGALKLEDVRGDVDLTAGQGLAEVRTVRGDVTLRGGYGETRVSGVAGHVSVDQRFGSARVELTGPADLAIALGELEVTLARTGGWTVDAVTEMGDVSTALPLAREQSGASGRVFGTVGDGSHPLKIQVNRATARLYRR